MHHEQSLLKISVFLLLTCYQCDRDVTNDKLIVWPIEKKKLKKGNTFWIIPVKGFITAAVLLVLSYSGTPPI